MSEPLSTPAGWKLVPAAPTTSQKDAGGAVCGSRDIAHEVYHQMLSASPSPEALPASGVDVVAIAAIICEAMDDLRVDIHFDIDGKEQAADWAAYKIASLSSSPAPEDREASFQRLKKEAHAHADAITPPWPPAPTHDPEYVAELEREVQELRQRVERLTPRPDTSDEERTQQLERMWKASEAQNTRAYWLKIYPDGNFPEGV